MYVSDTDPNAPWNQSDNPTASGTISVDVCLTGIATVETDEVEEDADEDGRCIVPSKDADWNRAYEESDFSILKLLGELAKIADEKSKDFKSQYDKCKDPKERRELYKKWVYWHSVCEHSKGWKLEQVDCERL